MDEIKLWGEIQNGGWKSHNGYFRGIKFNMKGLILQRWGFQQDPSGPSGLSRTAKLDEPDVHRAREGIKTPPANDRSQIEFKANVLLCPPWMVPGAGS